MTGLALWICIIFQLPLLVSRNQIDNRTVRFEYLVRTHHSVIGICLYN